MAITYDTNSQASTPNGSSLTWSHTVNAGLNSILIVPFVYAENSLLSVSSVTYSGQALTQAKQFLNTPSAIQWVSNIYYLLAPPVGSANIIITLSGASDGIGAVGLSAFGIAQTDTVIGSGNETSVGSGTSLSLNVTAPGVQSLIIDAFSVDAGSSGLTPGASQTEHGEVDTGGRLDMAASSKINTGGADTMAWSWTTAGTGIVIAIPFRAEPDPTSTGSDAYTFFM
ncbi:hypothetical protein M0R04_15085 [Candidatus Dojkabacteria bacterium]|jgi:hypothetical protein|nr:hypothetical protein [Candidatus Dojkabacteria bacterium]